MLNKKGKIAILQILILVIGIVAVGYGIGVVSGQESYDTISGEVHTVDGGVYAFKKPVAKTADVSSPPPAATEPAFSTSHSGYAGKAYSALTGEPAAPKGYAYDKTTGNFIKSSGAGSSSGFAYSLTGIAQGALWALTAYYVVGMVGDALGLEKSEVEAAQISIAGGIFAGKFAYSVFGPGGIFAGTNMGTGLWGATGIGIAVAVIIFLQKYKKETTETVEVNCNPWEPKTGGSNCEKCNQQGILACSEYQCRSLGQSCELLNEGTDDAKCVWVNKNDVKPPVIETDEEALLEGYVYKPDNTISPPDSGVVVYNKNSKDGCAKAFTPLKFGVKLNEPAKCKIDYSRKQSFDEMNYFLGSSSFDYEHEQVMSLPGSENLEAEGITVQNGGEYELYVICQDANGNYNLANFVFKFCIDEGPDTTPPLIVTTSVLNGAPVAYNQNSTALEVYTNEPADCKWSKLDQDYEDMENSMSCSSSVLEMNAQMVYKCKTILTGLKNNFENKFYFRCEDKPQAASGRNVNQESYVFSLHGTKPLYIESVKPNETIKDSTDTVKVTLEAKTAAGYNEGEAECYYSETGEEDDYLLFYETKSYEHSQDLYLPEGNYEYWIKCLDLGGNSDVRKTKFKVETDSSSPIVTRAYHEENYLKLITNEKSECVYDTTNCNYLFEDGTPITNTDGITHFTTWNTNINYYIKCIDEYGNEPLPNKCSIVARPFED
jgi:hypothetical protein